MPVQTRSMAKRARPDEDTSADASNSDSAEPPLKRQKVSRAKKPAASKKNPTTVPKTKKPVAAKKPAASKKAASKKKAVPKKKAAPKPKKNAKTAPKRRGRPKKNTKEESPAKEEEKELEEEEAAKANGTESEPEQAQKEETSANEAEEAEQEQPAAEQQEEDGDDEEKEAMKEQDKEKEKEETESAAEEQEKEEEEEEKEKEEEVAEFDVGSIAPDFQDVLNEKGEKVSLGDFKGQYLVIYFYPKDNTPGCTNEGKRFRDLNKEFKERNCAILGVSADKVESHKKFADKHEFNFSLLADTSRELIKAYKAVKPGNKILRSTVLIDPEGKIAKIWKSIRGAAKHPDQVLKELKALQDEN